LILSERGRVDPIKSRWLVKLHERVRIQPMAAGSIVPIDQNDLGVAVVDQRVDERHP
jgi:hypothetical protein